jgi:hypothetical protein
VKQYNSAEFHQRNNPSEKDIFIGNSKMFPNFLTSRIAIFKSWRNIQEFGNTAKIIGKHTVHWPGS